MNGTALALDIAAFGDRALFLNNVDTLGDAITAQPIAPGTDRRRAHGPDSLVPPLHAASPMP